MLFIHPMWFSESQRIGKQKCTPFGYVLHGIAEMIGFAGLLCFLIIALNLVYRGITSTFTVPDLWMLAAPFGIGLISEVFYQYSWWLAARKGYQYNYERDEATWLEAGERISYRWTSNVE